MATANIKLKSDVPSSVERAAQVFDEHGDFIRSVIHYHVRNKAEAEDLFQDLFLCIVARPIPEEVQNVRGFLYKLITDTIKDAYRRIIRYQTRIRKYAERHLHIIESHPAASLIDVEENKKMFDLIERNLPTKEALAVKLRYKENCDTEEAAGKMGVKTRSVSRYVSIGLKKIGHVLDKKQGSNYDSCQS
ncbi:MAG: RNA polymerase sigma factor [Planctomycetota bacterium]